ncbi:MAG: LD-carboxypeptidase [Cyanobacteria bacterium REEB459]|nr:LD-carboxypeptidase [Cyanobacteria bacterium REEB459]
MQRRHIVRGLGGLGAAMATQAKAVSQPPPVRKPPRLQRGDHVGIISPAGATYDADRLELVIDAIKGLGFVPRVAPHALDRYGYLAGRDRDRAADINGFFGDPQISALIPIRGDWGSARVLPYLDYAAISRHPKVLIGFSDITALLLAIQAQTGLVTFHGPHGLTAWRQDQVEGFRRLLMEAEALSFSNPLVGADQDRLMRDQGRIYTLTPGQARGALIGGNLSVLCGLVGSPYMPTTRGRILFLEDVGEPPYRIDRMITHLKLAGVLDHLAGLIFGQCGDCNPGEGYGSLTLREILQDHIQPLGIPAWMGAWIGHVEPMWTLPLGTQVTIDAAAGHITMVEAAVEEGNKV